MVLASGKDLMLNSIHGVNDSTRGWIGALLGGAAIAAAAYNSKKAFDIATDEWKLAKKYWQISQNWLNYYRDYYAPVEDQEVAEASNIPLETPMYDMARGRARAAAFLEFRGLLQKNLRCIPRYNTGMRNEILADITAAQADAVAMADGLGYRNERAYVESRNDERFERMLNTAKRGRDMVADNVSLGRATAGIYGDMFDQAWAGLEGAGQWLGYASQRQGTQYPTTYSGPATYNRPNSELMPQEKIAASGTTGGFGLQGGSR